MRRRRRVFAAVLIAAAAVAGTAYAGVTCWVHAAGVLCGFGTGPQGRGVACSLDNDRGYKVTLTRTRVVVRAPDGKQKLFERRQP